MSNHLKLCKWLHTSVNEKGQARVILLPKVLQQKSIQYKKLNQNNMDLSLKLLEEPQFVA